MGLCTNFHKSSTVPIRCNHLELEPILRSIPVTRATFPIKYLGLPLSVWQLRKVDFQYLEGNAAGKLVTYEGQSIITIWHTALVRSVITSQAVYSITPLIVPQGSLQNINKIERAFLWSGSDTTGAKCKVN